MSFTFEKESILPPSDTRSPFYYNLPPRDSKPIDDLIKYFKLWKHFIKSLIAYFKDLATSKELEASLSYQLIGSIEFPGFKDLPRKYINTIESSKNSGGQNLNKELKKSASGTSLSSMPFSSGSNTLQHTSTVTSTASTPSNNKGASGKRPGLLRAKSNNSTFLKNSNASEPLITHKRSGSSTNFLKSFNNLGQAAYHNVSGTSQNSSSSPVSTFQAMNTNDIQVPSNFFPENSLFNNLAPILVNHHFQYYNSQMRLLRELNQKLIPRMESLLKNLSLKIKEIKANLKNESFINDRVALEISDTGKILAAFVQSVERYSAPRPVIKKSHVDDEELDEEGDGLDDPFLIKLKVDFQLRKQILQENYMFASFVNLQNISKDLFTYMNKELSSMTDRLAKLANSEAVYASSSANLVVNLLFNIQAHIETASGLSWEHFIVHNKSFLNLYKNVDDNLKKTPRYLESIVLPYTNSIHTRCLKWGYMYKKQKLLKSYHSNFYVLSCNYLHEFDVQGDKDKDPTGLMREARGLAKDEIKSKKEKTKKKDKQKLGGVVGPDDDPCKSYNLNKYILKSKDPSNFKFVLQKISDPNKKITFKCADSKDYESWYSELSVLSSFGSEHYKRFSYVLDQIASKDAEKSFQEQEQLKKQQALAAATAAHSHSSETQPGNPPKQRTASDAASVAFSVPRSFDSQNSRRTDNSDISSELSSLAKEQFVLNEPTIFSSGSNTPASLHSSEKNPFETTFSGAQSFSSSPNLSPNSSMSNFTTNYSQAFNGNQATNSNPTLDAINKNMEHETYLKLQKQFLRQQQELLDLKIQESESYNKQCINQIVHNTSQGSMKVAEFLSPSSRGSSADSINSMVHQNQLQDALRANEVILNNKNRYEVEGSSPGAGSGIFKLPSNNSGGSNPGTPKSEIPTVFVSSNH